MVRTSWHSEAQLIKEVLNIDLNSMGLVSRGKLPVFESLNDKLREEHRTNWEFTNSSFDEVICINDPDRGYPAVLLIDYDGTTHGRIVHDESGPSFVPMSGMIKPGTDVEKRTRISNHKIRASMEMNTPYVILPVLAQQKLLHMRDEFLVARFAVIRGLLTAMEIGILDRQIVTPAPHFESETVRGVQSNQDRRDLIIPFMNRWHFVQGRLDFGSRGPLELVLGEGLRANQEDTVANNQPRYEPDVRVDFRPTPGPHPNWSVQFSHLSRRTLEITEQQVQSRAGISEMTLLDETSHTSEAWPTLIFHAGPPESEINVEIQLDGFQTNFPPSEELMYSPYLGILGSMIIEAGLLGDILRDEMGGVWKPGAIEQFREEE